MVYCDIVLTSQEIPINLGDPHLHMHCQDCCTFPATTRIVWHWRFNGCLAIPRRGVVLPLLSEGLLKVLRYTYWFVCVFVLEKAQANLKFFIRVEINSFDSFDLMIKQIIKK